jgi:hypothetical protein
MGYHQGGQLPPGGHMSTRNLCMGWDDQHHPRIKEMMHNYLVCTNGHIHLAEILDIGGKQQSDLPTLPKYVHSSGQPFLCWLSIHGRCTFRDCCFCKEGGHPLPADITDEFVNRCINAINKGIIALSGHQGGSPNKKLKGGDGNPQARHQSPANWGKEDLGSLFIGRCYGMQFVKDKSKVGGGDKASGTGTGPIRVQGRQQAHMAEHSHWEGSSN